MLAWDLHQHNPREIQKAFLENWARDGLIPDDEGSMYFMDTAASQIAIKLVKFKCQHGKTIVPSCLVKHMSRYGHECTFQI